MCSLFCLQGYLHWAKKDLLAFTLARPTVIRIKILDGLHSSESWKRCFYQKTMFVIGGLLWMKGHHVNNLHRKIFHWQIANISDILPLACIKIPKNWSCTLQKIKLKSLQNKTGLRLSWRRFEVCLRSWIVGLGCADSSWELSYIDSCRGVCS